jgi:hypothetical protein
MAVTRQIGEKINASIGKLASNLIKSAWVNRLRVKSPDESAP